MDTVTVFFLITGLMALALYLWTYTKPGKKWLEG